MDHINLKQLSLPEDRSKPVLVSKRPPRHKPGEKFLKGPIPLNWLAEAGQLRGKALHVAIVLWFQAGLKCLRTVKLSNAVMKRFGVDRYAAYRGLKALENAGLVSVERHAGRLPVVTILDVTFKEEAVELPIVN